MALSVDKLIRAKTGEDPSAYLREMIRTKSARQIAVELDVDLRSVLVRLEAMGYMWTSPRGWRRQSNQELEAMGYVWTSPRGWRKPRKQQEAAA